MATRHCARAIDFKKMSSTISFSSSVSRVNALASKPRHTTRRSRCVVTKAANVIDTARANGLNAFADAVTAHGLADAINSASFTVFAPNDAAFKAFTNPDGTHSIADVLKFHVGACARASVRALWD